MDREVDDIKFELKSLCEEFMDILSKMKEKNIISEEEYKEYSSKKIEFLQN
ncbi:hypothetical protein [Tepidibacter formicigenes]|jgi:hypothetical protein|uniref:Short C-terminal domain-containing protein n=1 Tax=Tepidibacter formicigenes DSM 15518 TaxID=1123349 RepID=A0A1M6T226_9FIRM|nr:hypothetical protein [Tepidibacter formicigenes]SHK51024.1 hypothetical protein SAMN02744037_02490 [Tepidibacter formicigenes DSM 15518]